MNYNLKLTLLLLFPLTTVLLHSSSISGFVKDSSNQEVLIGATVRVEGSSRGAQTNKDGYYVISNLDKGNTTITISYIGYEPKTLKFDLDSDEDKRLNIKLNQGSVSTTELSVYGDRDDDKVEISISKVNIPIQQI